MNFSEMKLHAMNAVKAYFRRDWKRKDMMNSADMPLRSHTSLKKVYCTLFYALLSSSFGSFSHLTWEVGGLFTVLSSLAILLQLYLISPLRVRTRVFLLMIAAFFFGASVDLFTKYLFQIDEAFVLSLLASSTIGTGTLWFGAILTRERREIYACCLIYSCLLMFCSFFVDAFNILDSDIARCMLEVCAVLTLFMGYLVVYSQEILYNVRYGNINFVNCALTIFFHLPAILVHAARQLYLGTRTKRNRNMISWGVECTSADRRRTLKI